MAGLFSWRLPPRFLDGIENSKTLGTAKTGPRESRAPGLHMSTTELPGRVWPALAPFVVAALAAARPQEPCARRPYLREASNSSLMNWGNAMHCRTGLGVGDEAGRVPLHQ